MTSFFRVSSIYNFNFSSATAITKQPSQKTIADTNPMANNQKIKVYHLPISDADYDWSLPELQQFITDALDSAGVCQIQWDWQPLAHRHLRHPDGVHFNSKGDAKLVHLLINHLRLDHSWAVVGDSTIQGAKRRLWKHGITCACRGGSGFIGRNSRRNSFSKQLLWLKSWPGWEHINKVLIIGGLNDTDGKKTRSELRQAIADFATLCEQNTKPMI